MKQEWQELKNLTRDEEITVERVRMDRTGVAIEGNFALPAMCKLSEEDQLFVAAFIRFHGSIKEMEKLFGISYPTVKGRLNRISDQLNLIDINPPAPREGILTQLEQGEITVEEAEEALRRSHDTHVA